MKETSEMNQESGWSDSWVLVNTLVGDGGSGGRANSALYALVCLGGLARFGAGSSPDS